MTCMPIPCEASTGAGSPPALEWPGAMAREVRNRQAAVRYLQVAAETDAAGVRERLRRRAAQLISIARDDRRPRLDS